MFGLQRGIWDLGDRDTLTTIVVCKSCGLAAHGVCCFPPVPQLHPNARWRCDNCSVCRSCGYRDAHWTDYTVWDATFSYCAKYPHRHYRALTATNKLFGCLLFIFALGVFGLLKRGCIVENAGRLGTR